MSHKQGNHFLITWGISQASITQCYSVEHCSILDHNFTMQPYKSKAAYSTLTHVVLSYNVGAVWQFIGFVLQLIHQNVLALSAKLHAATPQPMNR